MRRAPDCSEYGTAEHERTALRQRLAAFTDQDFSLADAVRFAVMTEHHIRDELTFDRL